MAHQQKQNSTLSARDRLLAAAIKIFALHGFDGASTRLLAKEAKVNISAIPYYFTNKEGLYVAVIQHITSIVRTAKAKNVAEINDALSRGDLTPAAAQTLLLAFVKGFSEFLLSEHASPYMAQIMVREQLQPSFAFHHFHEELMQPIHETLTRLVAFLINVPETDMKAILCTHTIFGQTAIFKTHKTLLLRRAGWDDYSPKETQAITQIILQNTEAIIATHRKT